MHRDGGRVGDRDGCMCSSRIDTEAFCVERVLVAGRGRDAHICHLYAWSRLQPKACVWAQCSAKQTLKAYSARGPQTRPRPSCFAPP